MSTQLAPLLDLTAFLALLVVGAGALAFILRAAGAAIGEAGQGIGSAAAGLGAGLASIVGAAGAGVGALLGGAGQMATGVGRGLGALVPRVGGVGKGGGRMARRVAGGAGLLGGLALVGAGKGGAALWRAAKRGGGAVASGARAVRREVAWSAGFGSAAEAAARGWVVEVGDDAEALRDLLATQGIAAEAHGGYLMIPTAQLGEAAEALRAMGLDLALDGSGAVPIDETVIEGEVSDVRTR